MQRHRSCSSATQPTLHRSDASLQPLAMQPSRATPSLPLVLCPNCTGKGTVTVLLGGGESEVSQCVNCDGAGSLTCTTCQWTGIQQHYLDRRLFKISKEIEKMSDTDFISELPDSLLIHILSFMTTRDAMRTRWVAKRWRKLWAFVTVLDLSEFYNDFHHPFYSCVTEEFSCGQSSFLESLSSKQHCCQEFESFVKALLHLRETSQLDTFRFAWECHSPPSSCRPNLDFLLDVLKFRPRVVHFSLDLMVEWRTALDPLFTCVSLEEMVLHVCFKEFKTRGFRIFEDSSLSCGPELIHTSSCKDSYCNIGGTQKPLFGIKTINLSFLERLELSDLEIRTNFMMGCPLIEKLRLSRCKLFISEISSNTLKYLEILSCCSNKETQVSTRNLIYLGIGIDASGISFKSMPSLMKVCINFSYLGSIGLIDGEFRLLSLLSNVTSLDIEVTSDAKIMLERELQKCPAFNNLKTLMLEGYSDEILDLVVCFMHQVPRLDKLSLDIYERGKCLNCWRHCLLLFAYVMLSISSIKHHPANSIVKPMSVGSIVHSDIVGMPDL